MARPALAGLMCRDSGGNTPCVSHTAIQVHMPSAVPANTSLGAKEGHTHTYTHTHVCVAQSACPLSRVSNACGRSRCLHPHTHTHTPLKGFCVRGMSTG